MKDLVSYIITRLQYADLRHEVRTFDSSAVMVDFWIGENLYVIQTEENRIGMSHVTEDTGLDTRPDQWFEDALAFRQVFEPILDSAYNRDIAKKHIRETCGEGWLNLVDILFDNKPEGISITEVFQKWGGLKVSYTGENIHFEELADTVYHISEKMCEVCGASARCCIMDGWETALCDRHYQESDAREKYREEKI